MESTADPTKVLSTRLLATVTSEEAAKLTYFGSEVRGILRLCAWLTRLSSSGRFAPDFRQRRLTLGT